MTPNPTLRPSMDGLRVREAPVNGKPIGQVDSPDLVESLESHEDTLRKVQTQGEWLKIRTPEGIVGFVAAWMMIPVNVQAPAPTPTPTPPLPPVPSSDTELYVRPTMDGLRVREKPVDGQPVGQVSMHHALEVLEPAAEARAKIGQQGQWIKIRKPDGEAAFVAAWFVQETKSPVAERKARLSGIRNIIGMNLDNFHPLGTPTPERLGPMGWVRFGYNVSAGTGSQDIQKAYEIYAPLAERYANAGLKVMFAVTHQTYGEGVNEFWPWPSMTDDKWKRLTDRFTEMMGRIAKQYAGEELVHCWQIWNEQDAPIGAVASVPMPPHNYAHLLAQTIKAIKAVDSAPFVITGGHTRGPADGSAYARATIKAMPADVRPDGVAFHPYGRGTRPGTRYANWGHMEEELAAYVAVLPDRPVWITEWGVLDKEGDPAQDVAAYAAEFIDYLNGKYAGKVAAAIWYAWAMGMHNGYGLVGRDDQPLNPLYARYLALKG